MPELAEGARLLSEYPAQNGIEGSNPSLSAILRQGFGWQAILFNQRSLCVDGRVIEGTGEYSVRWGNCDESVVGRQGYG